MSQTNKIALVLTILTTIGIFGVIGAAIWYLPIPTWVRIGLTIIVAIRCIVAISNAVNLVTKIEEEEKSKEL